MANIMIKRGNLDNIVTYKHICDTVEDMPNIDPQKVTLGSFCIVIKGEKNNLETYIADSNKKWNIYSINDDKGSDSSAGIKIHICGNDEYDSTTGEPIVENPIGNQFYLVPSSGTDNSDLFEEWIYINGNWEKFGGKSIDIPTQNQVDWNESDDTKNTYIQNKPPIRKGIGVDSIVESWAANAKGTADHAEGWGTLADSTQYNVNPNYYPDGSGAAHAEGYQTQASGAWSHAEGEKTLASSKASHAEGIETVATQIGSHAEGYRTQATQNYSHAEGFDTDATGKESHAEGSATKADGRSSHAEGTRTYAGGDFSHAEGNGTEATGAESHSEGMDTEASGVSSHAEGVNTIAKNKSQHVFGEWNIEDPSGESEYLRGKYIEIVGNGERNKRSNARLLDWEGNEWLAGNLTLNKTTLTEAQLKNIIKLNISLENETLNFII